MKKISPYFKIFLAAILLAFNYYIFIVTNNFAPAGLNGIATMIQYKTGFSISYIIFRPYGTASKTFSFLA